MITVGLKNFIETAFFIGLFHADIDYVSEKKKI